MELLKEQLAGQSRLITFLSLFPIATLIGEFLLRGNPLVTLLALIPANTFLRRTFTWNLFTHMLVETDWPMGIAAAAVLQTWGSAVVTEWGAIEFAKLVLALNAFIGVLTVVFAAASHGSTMWLYEYHCGGAYTLSAAVGAYAQLFPDRIVFAGALPELRARHAPLLLALFLVLYDAVRKGPTPTESEAIAEVDVWRGHCAAFAPLAMWFVWAFGQKMLQHRQQPIHQPFHDLFFPAPVREVMARVGTAMEPVGKVFGCGPASAADLLAAQHANTMFSSGAAAGGSSANGGLFGRSGHGGLAAAVGSATLMAAGGHHAAVTIPPASATAVAASASLLVPSAAADGAAAAEEGAAAAAAAETKRQLARSALAKRLAMGSASAVVPSSVGGAAGSARRQQSAVPMANAAASGVAATTRVSPPPQQQHQQQHQQHVEERSGGEMNSSTSQVMGVGAPKKRD